MCSVWSYARASPGHLSLDRRNVLLVGGSRRAVAVAASVGGPSTTAAEPQQQPQPPATPSGRRPNILMIMADDIGWFNVSIYNHGIMGYRTPNIDRIGKEGAMFTDWYGEQSRPPGRAALITGQSPIPTCLTQ